MLKVCENFLWNLCVVKCLFFDGVMLCVWCKSFSDCVNVSIVIVVIFLCISIIMCFV